MPPYRDRAIVLRSWKLGETDRIVSLLTRSNGRVRAVVKGARKPKSKLGGKVEPFGEIEVSLWKGRSELQTLSQAESLSTRSSTYSDLDRMLKASVVVEVAERISVEEHEQILIFDLVSKALAALEREDSPFFIGAFLLRVLSLEGVAPELRACRICGDGERIATIDLQSGELGCVVHPMGLPLLPEILSLLRKGSDGRVGEVLAYRELAVAHEFERISVGLFENALSMRIKTAHSTMLEGLEDGQ